MHKEMHLTRQRYAQHALLGPLLLLRCNLCFLHIMRRFSRSPLPVMSRAQIWDMSPGPCCFAQAGALGGRKTGLAAGPGRHTL